MSNRFATPNQPAKEGSYLRAFLRKREKDYRRVIAQSQRGEKGQPPKS